MAVQLLSPSGLPAPSAPAVARAPRAALGGGRACRRRRRWSSWCSAPACRTPQDDGHWALHGHRRLTAIGRARGPSHRLWRRPARPVSSECGEPPRAGARVTEAASARCAAPKRALSMRGAASEAGDERPLDLGTAAAARRAWARAAAAHRTRSAPRPARRAAGAVSSARSRRARAVGVPAEDWSYRARRVESGPSRCGTPSCSPCRRRPCPSREQVQHMLRSAAPCSCSPLISGPGGYPG